MKLITAKRLGRIRNVGGRLLGYPGMQGFGRRHLAGLRRRLKAKEDELQKEQRDLQDRQTSLEARIDRIRGPAAVGTTSPTLLLLNDCGDQDNFGTEALMDGLAVIFSETISAARFRSIPSHWVMDASAFSSAFPDGGKNLRQPAPAFPVVVDQFDEIADEWQTGRGGPGVSEYLAKLKGIDLVILNGEGSIYRTNLSAIRELFLVWFAKTRLGIPAIFVNGTVHLTDVVPILPAMVRKVFGVLDAVAVREPFSLRNLRTHTPDIPVRLIPDAAFVHTADQASAAGAVTAVRKQLGGRGYFCYDPGPMTVDNRTPKRSAEHLLISELKGIVSQAVLIPSPPVLRHVEELARIADETDSIYAGKLRDYREYMALVRDAEFVVSGRHHDTIFAAITGCPTIALAGASHKVHGVCELLDGLVGTPYDSTDFRSNIEAIKRRAGDYVSNQHTLRPALQGKAHELGEATLEMGQMVNAALGREVYQR